MSDAMQIAATGLRSEQRQIDVISNNVANMQTPGFKKSRVNFADVAAAYAAQAGAAPESIGNGTRVVSTSTFYSGGELKATQNPWDIAIDGNGFFELEGVDGAMFYSRAGQFHVDTDGNLVNTQGLRLANGFQVPADARDIRVAANGDVTAKVGSDANATLLGSIQLVTFASPDALVSVGDNRYTTTEAAGAPTTLQPGSNGTGTLQQGYVELANVELIDEMSSLVLAQRSYQMNARVLQAADQILETINNLRR